MSLKWELGEETRTSTRATFDLSYITNQLSPKPEYRNWTPERFAAATEEYYKFLLLCKQNRGQEIVPSPDVDEIWHRHILNTSRYMTDCKAYFGYYLHHLPAVPTKTLTEEGKEKMLRTMFLYQETFGQPSQWFPKMEGFICDSGCGSNSVKPAQAYDCSGGGEGDCGSGCTGGDDITK